MNGISNGELSPWQVPPCGKDFFLLNDTFWGWCLIAVNSPNATCIQSLGRPQQRFTPTRKSYEVASEKESERETSIARISVSFPLNWFSQAVFVAACLRNHFSKSYRHLSQKNSFKKVLPNVCQQKASTILFQPRIFHNSQGFLQVPTPKFIIRHQGSAKLWETMDALTPWHVVAIAMSPLTLLRLHKAFVALVIFGQ